MRAIHDIAREILREWRPVHPWAAPYASAMLALNSIDDSFGFDPGREIVARFLCNAKTFRGPEARRIKAELKEQLGRKLSKAEKQALADWRDIIAMGKR